MALLRQMKEEGKYIFIVHHDLSKVATYFDQLLLLNRKLIAFGPTATVAKAPLLRQAFGEQLLVWEAK